MRRILRWLGRTVQQLCCAHENKQLAEIVRDPESTQRFSRYRCPDCAKQWFADDLPAGWLRNTPR